MNSGRLLVAVVILAAPMLAFAGPANGNLPEPETLALIGVGAVALVIARWRNKK